MFSVRHLLKKVQPPSCRAHFSSDAMSGPMPSKTSGFKRVMNFISKNRQPLLNVMQEAWKEQEKKIAQLSSELQLIHDNFDDDEWYGVSAATLQGSKDLKGALKTLIQAKLEERPATTSDSVPVPTSSDQIPGLSDVLGDSTKTSSKMI